MTKRKLEFAFKKEEEDEIQGRNLRKAKIEPSKTSYPAYGARMNYYSAKEDEFFMDALVAFRETSSKEVGVSGFWVEFSEHYNNIAAKQDEFKFVERTKDSLRRRFNRVYKRAMENDDGSVLLEKAKIVGRKGKSTEEDAEGDADGDVEGDVEGNAEEGDISVRSDNLNEENGQEAENEEEEEEEESNKEKEEDEEYENEHDNEDNQEEGEALQISFLKSIHKHFINIKAANSPLQVKDRVVITQTALQEMKDRLENVNKKTLTGLLAQYCLGLVESDDEKQKLLQKVELLEKESKKSEMRLLRKEVKMLRRDVKKGSKKYKYRYKYKGDRKSESENSGSVKEKEDGLIGNGEKESDVMENGEKNLL